MRIFLLGSTGRTGGQALDVALGRGHHVTAFVRSPGKLRPRSGLTIVAGDPADPAALTKALPGHEAVLSALGAAPREALRPSTLMTDLARSTVRAMQATGVERIGIVSAAVLFPEKGLFFAFFRWLLRHHARDLATMEEEVQAAGVEWTIARPPRLLATAEDTCRVATGALPEGGRVASFRATATFLVNALERGTHPSPRDRGARPMIAREADLATFEGHRARLLALAYRMLGDVGRAEDVVQEAWVRWSGRETEAHSSVGFLVAIVTRLCLNELDSAKTRREESRGEPGAKRVAAIACRNRWPSRRRRCISSSARSNSPWRSWCCCSG